MLWYVIQTPGVHKQNREYRELYAVRRALVSQGDECVCLSSPEIAASVKGRKPDVVILMEQYRSTCFLSSILHAAGAFPLWETSHRLLWEIDSHVQSVTYYEGLARLFRPTLTLQANESRMRSGSLLFPNCVDDLLFFDKQSPRDYRIGPGIAYSPVPGGRQNWLDAVGEGLTKAGLPTLQSKQYLLGADYVEFLNSLAVGLNVNIGCDINYRTFEVPACGALLLSTGKARLAPLGFRDGENCLLFSSPEEAVSKFQAVSNHPKDIAEMASSGRELVTKHHTYRVRMNQLRKHLEK